MPFFCMKREPKVDVRACWLPAFSLCDFIAVIKDALKAGLVMIHKSIMHGQRDNKETTTKETSFALHLA